MYITVGMEDAWWCSHRLEDMCNFFFSNIASYIPGLGYKQGGIGLSLGCGFGFSI